MKLNIEEPQGEVIAYNEVVIVADDEPEGVIIEKGEEE